MSVETVGNALAHLDSLVPKLEAQLAPLKKESERVQVELEKHAKDLSDMQREVEQLKQQYQAECRKLACGEPSKALELKASVQEIEAKIEGLKQLLADAQQKATAPRARFAEAERELARLRREREVASRHLKAEESLQRVGDKLLLLLEEVGAAKRAVNDLHLDESMRPYMASHGNRLWNLEEKLREARVRFF